MEPNNTTDLLSLDRTRFRRACFALDGLALIVSCYSTLELLASLSVVARSGRAAAVLAGHGAWGLVAGTALLASLRRLNSDGNALSLVRAAYVMTAPWALSAGLLSLGSCFSGGLFCLCPCTWWVAPSALMFSGFAAVPAFSFVSEVGVLGQRMDDMVWRRHSDRAKLPELEVDEDPEPLGDAGL